MSRSLCFRQVDARDGAQRTADSKGFDPVRTVLCYGPCCAPGDKRNLLSLNKASQACQALAVTLYDTPVFLIKGS